MNIGFPPPCDITICITIISPTKLCAPQKTHYWFCFILIISYCADQNSLLVLDAINLTSDSVFLTSLEISIFQLISFSYSVSIFTRSLPPMVRHTQVFQFEET